MTNKFILFLFLLTGISNKKLKIGFGVDDTILKDNSLEQCRVKFRALLKFKLPIPIKFQLGSVVSFSDSNPASLDYNTKKFFKNFINQHHYFFFVTVSDLLVAGESYLNQMCGEKYNYGWLNGNFSKTTLIHELLHTMNVAHDEETNCKTFDKNYIMSIHSNDEASKLSACTVQTLKLWYNKEYKKCLK